MQTYYAYIPGISQDPAAFGVYPRSVHALENGAVVFMARETDADYIVCAGDCGFVGEAFVNAAGTACVKAPLSHENAALLRRYFPFTAPVRVLNRPRTVGVGDRLGIATPGHIRVFERYDAMPVLAQQSMRELNLTGRTYQDVLDSVTFAVFREDFTRGFGADGDHLKTAEEVNTALACGYTMITLDCSEYIRNDIDAMTDADVEALYHDSGLEKTYVGQCFKLSEALTLTFDEMSFKRMALIYGKAIDFICEIYDAIIKRADVDFEISVDETASVTTPLQHYFVANELMKRGVRFATLAPRFCGEFQKGVDYIGDLEQFRKQFAEHAIIADHFGYKLSVHSGSDKFAVFPLVGALSSGRFHLKTAGTNWLTAMCLAAMKDAALYREAHTFALSVFEEARRYYHVTTNLGNIPDVSAMADEELPGLFEQNDARQLIHITYGLILNAKNQDGSWRFRERLYRLWREYGEIYAEMLDAHIGRHLALLYGETD